MTFAPYTIQDNERLSLAVARVHKIQSSLALDLVQRSQEASILLLTLQPEVSASRTGIPARGNSTLWSGAQCSVRARRHYWHDRLRGFRQGN
jgi:hypothetical protein